MSKKPVLQKKLLPTPIRLLYLVPFNKNKSCTWNEAESHKSGKEMSKKVCITIEKVLNLVTSEWITREKLLKTPIRLLNLVQIIEMNGVIIKMTNVCKKVRITIEKLLNLVLISRKRREPYSSLN